MTEEEQKLFRLYGKLPNKKNVINKNLKVSLPSSPSPSPYPLSLPLLDAPLHYLVLCRTSEERPLSGCLAGPAFSLDPRNPLHRHKR